MISPRIHPLSSLDQAKLLAEVEERQKAHEEQLRHFKEHLDEACKAEEERLMAMMEKFHGEIIPVQETRMADEEEEVRACVCVCPVSSRLVCEFRPSFFFCRDCAARHCASRPLSRRRLRRRAAAKTASRLGDGRQAPSLRTMRRAPVRLPRLTSAAHPPPRVRSRAAGPSVRLLGRCASSCTRRCRR